jgi:hypothetical protein
MNGRYFAVEPRIYSRLKLTYAGFRRTRESAVRDARSELERVAAFDPATDLSQACLQASPALMREYSFPLPHADPYVTLMSLFNEQRTERNPEQISESIPISPRPP